MSGRLVVIGGGEHGRVVLEAAQLGGWNVLGFVDPAPCETTVVRCRVPRLGGDAELGALVASGALLVLGLVSSAERRATLVGGAPGAGWATVVHPAAVVSATAKLGAGVFIAAGAVINSGASIGEHAIVNTRSIVEHDVVIGAYAHISPGAVLGGGARVGNGAHIGLAACVRDHVQVGARSLVGMGAAVVGDVAEGQRVVGVPARPQQRSK